MKLINPTLEQLNEAFAVHVAGLQVGYGEVLTIEPDKNGESSIVDHQPIPRFTESADAVLPWLDKDDWKCDRYLSNAVDYHVVRIPRPLLGMGLRQYHESTEERSFAKAAVIALLRAHNVEIEFT